MICRNIILPYVRRQTKITFEKFFSWKLVCEECKPFGRVMRRKEIFVRIVQGVTSIVFMVALNRVGSALLPT